MTYRFLLDPWLLSAMLAGLFLRLFRLDVAALWLDETSTATWIAMPWKSMLETALADNHLPLYFIVLKIWASFAGTSGWALRFPSALLSWLVVPLTAGTADVLKDRTAARWAAWLAAVSPYLLQHAQDARMYALLGALAAINTLLLARFIVGKSHRLGVGFLLVNGALLATHYYSIFFVGAEFLTLVFLSYRRWRNWIAPMAVSCLLFIAPILSALFLARPTAGGAYDLGFISFPGLVWSLLTGYTLIPTSADLHSQGWRAALPYLPAAVLGLVVLIGIGAATIRSASRPAISMLGIVVVTTIIGPFMVGSVFQVGINPRYAMAAVPALLTLVALGCPALTARRLHIAAAATLGAIMVAASFLHLADPGHGREDIYAAAKWLDANVPNDQEILVTSAEMVLLAQFHWPERRFTLYPARNATVNRSNAEQFAADVPLPHTGHVIYIFGREWLTDPEGNLRIALKHHYRACAGTEVRGIQILCFLPDRH